VLYPDADAEVRQAALWKYAFAGKGRMASSDVPGQQGQQGQHFVANSFLASDHLKSVTSTSDREGVTNGESAYRAYGTTRNEKLLFDPYYRFSGKELEREGGLQYFGARYYYGALARFVSPDQLGQDVPADWLTDPQSLNLYVYARNNPIRYTDETGHWIESAIDGASLAVGIYAISHWNHGTSAWERALDVGCVALDTVALAVPILPGGAGFALKATRAGKTAQKVEQVIDSAKTLAPLGRLDLVANTVKAGKTVLGKFPDYTRLADAIGAKRFSIPPSVWDKMTKAEQWAANQKFLDRIIARGDEIILSNPVKEIKNVSGAFRKELDYLIDKGFKLIEDGTRLSK
jgi:RHS repeat-associated protein